MWLIKENRDEEENPNHKKEISNIQDCPHPSCSTGNQNVQGWSDGSIFNSGPVYENYVVYISNSTVNFPTDQNLGVVTKSKKYNFIIT